MNDEAQPQGDEVVGGPDLLPRFADRAVAVRAKTLVTSAALAGIGGFLDAFTYVGHGHVFANAMTGNVVLLGIEAVTGSLQASSRHLLPILMFLLGVACARVGRLPSVQARVRNPELAVLCIEMSVLFILSWLPVSTEDFAITMSIAFAASLQMATFREIGKKAYSSTFMTGNLRTMIESGFDWLFTGRSRVHLHETRDFAVICLTFFLGACAGGFTTPRMQNHALWIEVVALSLVLIWLAHGTRVRKSRGTEAEAG